MKKILLIAIAVFAMGSFSHAQTTSTSASTSTTSSQVAVGSSYVANSYINVYPGTNSAPYYNNSIRFRLNKGAKFFINKMVTDTNGTSTAGYIITIWNYPTNSSKVIFYNGVLKKQLAVIAAKAKLDSAKNDSLKTIQKIKKLQDSVKNAQVKAKTDTEKLVTSSLTLDASQTSSLTPADQTNLKKFLTAQTAVKTQLKTQGKAQDTSLSKLVNISAALISTNTAFETNKIALSQSKNMLAKYQADLNTAQSELAEKGKNIQSLRSVFKKALSDYQNGIGYMKVEKQSPNSKSITYNITKEQIGERPDINLDATSPAAAYDDLAYLDSWANGWQFFITSTDFNNNCTSIYPSSNKFTWGFLTLPLKLRFGNSKPGGSFNFEQNLNFGLTLGWKHQLISTSDVSYNILGGVSVVNVPLYNSTTTTNSSTAAAVSFSAGGMFQYNTFQIGIFGGLDYAGSNPSMFPYQGKPWIGIAIGVSLFGEGKTAATNTPSN